MTGAAAPHGLAREPAGIPMSRTHMRAVALTIMLSALDGYDVLSVTFAAPAISRGWGIGKVELGAVLSSGLAGMALGSFLLAPLADVIGRRRMIMVSLLLMAAGSLLSATAATVAALSAWRICTGLGIGTCVAIIAPLAAEFADARWRSFAVAAMAMGYPAGGLVGGLLAAALLRWSGWPAIFFAGGIAGLAMLAAVAAFLPESPAFLKAKDDRRGSGISPPVGSARGYAGVFVAEHIGATTRLAAVNMLTAAVIYYVLSWLPQLVSEAGFTPAQGSMVSATLSLVGIAGGLSLGAAARRRRPERLTAAAAALLGAAMVAFGTLPPSLPALMVAAGALGFLIFAASAGFYAVLALSFDDQSRASGSGFVIGTGRVSSALAPLAAGWLFAHGLDRATVSAVFGACALCASLVLALHRSPAGKAA